MELRAFECADHTCRHNIRYHCRYDWTWNKPSDKWQGCGPEPKPRRNALRRLQRKKRGRTLRATNRTGFNYVSRLGLLHRCIQNGKSFHKYGYWEDIEGN